MIPSASSADLAMAGCLHSFTAGEAYPEQPPEVFAFGNACHRVSEVAANGEPVHLTAIADAHELGAVDRRRLAAVADRIVVYLKNLEADGWTLQAEVPLAYDVDTGKGRILESRKQRDYLDAKPTEFTATADIVAMRGSELRVEDWKTGRSRRYDGVSWQLRICALAASRTLKLDAASVAMLYVDEDGLYQDRAEMDCWAFDEAAAALRDLWHRLQAGPTAPVAGAYCTEHYCRGLGHCAATRAALAEVGNSSIVRIETAADAARVWEMLPQAEAALKAARARIREIAGRQPVRLPSGRVLRVIQQERERLDLDAYTAQLVREAGAAEALEMTTSKAAIERTLAKPAAKQLIAQLRGAGAVKTSRYDIVKEVDDDAAE